MLLIEGEEVSSTAMNMRIILSSLNPRLSMLAKALIVVALCGEAWSRRTERTIARFDGDGRIVRDARGQRYEWSDRGTLVRLVDIKGYQTHYEYDTAGRRVAMTDALGRTWLFEYGPDDQLVATTDPTGRRRAADQRLQREESLDSFHYDSSGNLVRMTRTGSFQYERNGVLKRLGATRHQPR